MDPLGTVTTLVSLARYLWDAAEKVQQNREECKRLAKHAQEVAGLVDREYECGIPEDLRRRLNRLCETISGLTNMLDEVRSKPKLKQILRRNDVGDQIKEAYHDLSNAVGMCKMGMSLDMRRVMSEHEQARQIDSETMILKLDEGLSNDREIIDRLDLHKLQMQEAMVTIQKKLEMLESLSTESPLLDAGRTPSGIRPTLSHHQTHSTQMNDRPPSQRTPFDVPAADFTSTTGRTPGRPFSWSTMPLNATACGSYGHRSKPLDFSETTDEEALGTTVAIVNRAPVMTAWAMVVAECLGFTREEALSLASVYTELNAVSRGITLGVYAKGKDGSHEVGSNDAQSFIELMGRRPVFRSQNHEWRAISSGRPVPPATTYGYIINSMPQTASHVVSALRMLARSYSPDEVNERGYALYVKFRPEVKAWGERARLECTKVLALRKAVSDAADERTDR